MKKSKKILVTIATIFVLAFAVSCSGSDSNDEKSGCEDFEQVVTEASTSYSSALQIYYNEPTKANCATLKTETTKFIGVYNDYMDCIPEVERGEILKYIDVLQELIDETCP